MAMDDGIGRILRTLDELALREDTLVIFMTDHGGDPNYGGSNVPLRGNKATLFEGGIRVPCLARWPGVIEPGRETDQPAWALDWFPTWCALAGIPTRGLLLDGRDILGTWKPGASSADAAREFFWEMGRHAELARGNWAALRQGDWKYVLTPAGKEWLFNLARDPLEETDLSVIDSARLIPRD